MRIILRTIASIAVVPGSLLKKHLEGKAWEYLWKKLFLLLSCGANQIAD